MKLIVTKPTADIYNKNKFVITIDFFEDGVYQEDVILYIDAERYNNESKYTSEVHNLIEALYEIIKVDIDRERSYDDYIEELYSEYKIIKFLEYQDNEENLFNDLKIDIPMNPNTECYVPFYNFTVTYNDNEGINWNVTIDK
jgi:hypothetical protein